MKRISVLLLSWLLVGALTANAQHINCMGIPVDGTPTTIGKLLQKKGFEKKSETVYTGVFCEKNARVFLCTDSDGNVWRMGISVQENDLQSFKNTWQRFANDYTSVYGEPVMEKCTELNSLYTLSYNQWQTDWETELGYIMMFSGYDSGIGFILIAYTDDENEARRQQLNRSQL